MCRWKRERKAKAHRKSAVKVGGWVVLQIWVSGARLRSRSGQSGSVLKRAGTEVKGWIMDTCSQCSALSLRATYRGGCPGTCIC